MDRIPIYKQFEKEWSEYWFSMMVKVGGEKLN
jgi:hypothetical protein